MSDILETAFLEYCTLRKGAACQPSKKAVKDDDSKTPSWKTDFLQRNTKNLFRLILFSNDVIRQNQSLKSGDHVPDDEERRHRVESAEELKAMCSKAAAKLACTVHPSDFNSVFCVQDGYSKAGKVRLAQDISYCDEI